MWLGITEHFVVHAGLILVGSHNYMTWVCCFALFWVFVFGLSVFPPFSYPEGTILLSAPIIITSGSLVGSLWSSDGLPFKSDWLTIEHEYSAHARKCEMCQKLIIVVLAKRMAGCADKNGFPLSLNIDTSKFQLGVVQVSGVHRFVSFKTVQCYAGVSSMIDWSMLTEPYAILKVCL